MANTALNRTVVALLTNKSGGALNYGDVVIGDTANAEGFTTTTTAAYNDTEVGVIVEPNGIASNAVGMVATCGWVPKINLNTAATAWQWIKTHTVAGQGTPHSAPTVAGDFAIALDASATPAAILLGKPNQSAGAGSVTNTGTLTSGKTIIGNGGVDVTVSSLTAQFVGSSSGTAAAASMTTNRLLGRTTAGSGAVEEITPGASLVFSAGALNGRIVQVVNTETGAVATGTTAIPVDDTIPQNTEGVEYMTLAITPTNASNKLKIDVVVAGSCTAEAWLVAALFQDSTANALACARSYMITTTSGQMITFTHYMTAGTTSATTFKVRAGTGATNQFTFNGSNGVRQFGGVLASSITITEISV